MGPVQKTFVKARGLLARPRGWVQGKFKVERLILGNAYCAYGAIEASTTVDEVLRQSSIVFQGITKMSITCWNDMPKRTKSEVLEAFDNAIAIAKSRKI